MTQTPAGNRLKKFPYCISIIEGLVFKIVFSKVIEINTEFIFFIDLSKKQFQLKK
jgi:hypothetical protein